MESKVIFLITATFIAVLSMKLNYALTKQKISADRAFWFSWLFLIWSAEIVTSFPFFEYYYQYPIDSETRRLTLITFASAAAGFFVGSAAYRSSPGTSGSLKLEGKLVLLSQKSKGWISPAIFLFGIYGYTSNRSQFANLLDLRVAAVTGEIGVSTAMLQGSYFAMAFLMLLGFSDGYRGRMSMFAAGLCVVGLIFFNLSVGGRINIVVAPVLYLIPLAISARQRPHWLQETKKKVQRLLLFSTTAILVLFTAAQILRSSFLDSSIWSDPWTLILTTLFAIPMYVSDTFISIGVHTHHARESGAPFGYFTFDALYRAFGSFMNISVLNGNTIFGHEYYRDTPAPWAWTQANMIPRLVSDFGTLFWIGLLPVVALAQFLSLYRFRISFLGIVIRSLMLFSSAYSILAIYWMSASNVYMLLYAMVIYVFGRTVPVRQVYA